MFYLVQWRLEAAWPSLLAPLQIRRAPWKAIALGVPGRLSLTRAGRPTTPLPSLSPLCKEDAHRIPSRTKVVAVPSFPSVPGLFNEKIGLGIPHQRAAPIETGPARTEHPSLEPPPLVH